MVTPTELEKNFTTRNGGPTWPEDCFLTHVQTRREIISAHPVLTKAFYSYSPEAATLFAPFGCTHPPSPVPPFLLAKNLTLK